MADNPTDKFVDIGGLIRCFCGLPLGRRKDRNTIVLMRFHAGKTIRIETEYQGGSYKISCPTCGFGAIFQHFEESINTKDGVDIKADTE